MKQNYSALNKQFSFLVLDYNRPDESTTCLQSIRRNVKFDNYDRPFGREDINYPSKPNELNISKYLKYIFNRKDNVKVEFEVFPIDIQNKDPKLMISSLKDKILKLL